MSIDFEKIFDSVERVALVRALKYCRCDPRFIEVVMDIYMGDPTEIWRNGKVVLDTEITSGIRQGCTGSPQLFVMVGNIVINSIVESKLGYRDEEFYIPVLFYADDGLLWPDPVRREEMIQMVVEVAGKCGLCINKGKSSVLLYHCREGKPDEVGGMKVVSSIRLCFGECQKGKKKVSRKNGKFDVLNNFKIM